MHVPKWILGFYFLTTIGFGIALVHYRLTVEELKVSNEETMALVNGTKPSVLYARCLDKKISDDGHPLMMFGSGEACILWVSYDKGPKARAIYDRYEIDGYYYIRLRPNPVWTPPSGEPRKNQVVDYVVKDEDLGALLPRDRPEPRDSEMTMYGVTYSEIVKQAIKDEYDPDSSSSSIPQIVGTMSTP